MHYIPVLHKKQCQSAVNYIYRNEYIKNTEKYHTGENIPRIILYEPSGGYAKMVTGFNCKSAFVWYYSVVIVNTSPKGL